MYIFCYLVAKQLYIMVGLHPFKKWGILRRFKTCYFQPRKDTEKITLTDHTYYQHESSRRLRSLWGGLRRLLLIVQSDKNKLTNKQIIKDLEYFIILGNEEKLIYKIFAVEGFE